MNRKVTVVGGAGAVGATVARAIADKELADVVIMDVADQKAAGVGLDMLEACPIEGSDSRVVGYGANEEGWQATAGSDVVVITSGMPRKPGMSRDDLLNTNYKIMQAVTEQIVKYSPKTIIVPVANPLDAMAQAVYRLSKFPRERVIGMAGVLDSARMRTFIAMELNVSVENVHAFVLGGHGDTMVPLPRYSTVAGIPITELLSKERIDAISKRTADGGAEITKLVGTSAWYAPGSAAAEMVEIILKDKKKIVPCSVFLQGEYGVQDLFVGVPVKLGARGVEQIIQIKLTRGGRRGAQEVGRRRQRTGGRYQSLSADDAEVSLNQFSEFRSVARRYFAIHPRDVGDRDVLRAYGLALALVRAAAKSLGIVPVDHRDDPAFPFDLPLRQKRQVADLGRRE